VPGLLIVAAVLFARAPFLIEAAPLESVMGVVQKIFYFHVPAAAAAFLAALVCGVSSGAFLWRRHRAADQWAVAGAELAVVFGAIVLMTGPLWARKAWGLWWDWDARLTMTLVMWMVFVAYLLLRRFGGPGSEILAAVVGLFGAALVPFVYVSVNLWRTRHPTNDVVPTLPSTMAGPLRWCLAAFLVFCIALLILRAGLERQRARLEEAYVALED
jgi:heme exporter protein C